MKDSIVEPKEIKSVELKIYGKVQGVWYRASTKEKADELDLKGFVMNKPDGSVYAVAMGPEKQLKKLINWCHGGPPRAEVREVTVSESSHSDFYDFQIRQ